MRPPTSATAETTTALSRVPMTSCMQLSQHGVAGSNGQMIHLSNLTCQLLSQLSGYPNLTIMYSVLCCLAVSTGCAERALSKLKIVKNRLRSSLCVDTLSAVLVLASKKDLLAELSNNGCLGVCQPPAGC